MLSIETPIEKVPIERHFRRHGWHFSVHEARLTLFKVYGCLAHHSIST